MKKAVSKNEDQIMVNKFTQLMAEKRQAYQEIDDLQATIGKTKDRIKEINKELGVLIEVRTDYDPQERFQDFVVAPGIPGTGIAQCMIKYLEVQDTPISADEIFDAVKAQLTNRNKPISIKSIRSYLTNLKCFENIKKKDILAGKTHYSKPGWILNRDVLQTK